MTPATLERYRGDPVAFCREVLEVEVPNWQAEVMLRWCEGGTLAGIVLGRRPGKRVLLERMLEARKTLARKKSARTSKMILDKN